jgi:hypothetical protein
MASVIQNTFPKLNRRLFMKEWIFIFCNDDDEEKARKYFRAFS